MRILTCLAVVILLAGVAVAQEGGGDTVNPVGDDEPKPPAPPAGEPAAAPEEPPEEPEEPVAAQNPPGEVIVLSDDTFNAVAKQYEIVLVNFYADWCRFSQMLKPIYAASAKEMGEMNQVRLGSINCEADDTVATREGNHISKYPTIKVFRRGVALKSEYRGQRSPQAMAEYVRELLQSAMAAVESQEEIDQHIEKNKRALVGTFDSAENPLRENFKKIAEQLRDECHFVVHDGSSDVGESGASVKFKSTRDTDLFMGDLADHDSLFAWARDHCNPMVREITFENGEELTEEGLPFLIMFYDPANHDPVDDFTKIVNSRFPQERGNINFITADGTKFAHPLRHLGMAKTDLPVLAFDTFKHMHLFKQFSNVYREGILEKFVDDLHSGKLHHNFHHPPAAGEEEVYEKDISNQIEGAGAKAAPAGDGGAAAPDASADAPTVETPVAQPHDEGHPEDHEKDPEETLKEKLEEAEKQKRPDVPVSTPKPKAQGHAEEHEDEDAEDMSKPVVVKSILKNLKPSNNRYSFNHNRDEF